jgi:hypothetical protein
MKTIKWSRAPWKGCISEREIFDLLSAWVFYCSMQHFFCGLSSGSPKMPCKWVQQVCMLAAHSENWTWKPSTTCPSEVLLAFHFWETAFLQTATQYFSVLKLQRTLWFPLGVWGLLQLLWVCALWLGVNMPRWACFWFCPQLILMEFPTHLEQGVKHWPELLCN